MALFEDKEAALSGALQRAYNDFRDFCGIGIVVATEADADRRRAGSEKILQLGRRTPAGRGVEKPVAGEVVVVRPIARLGGDEFAIAV